MAATSYQSSGPAAITIGDGTAYAGMQSAYDTTFRQRLIFFAMLQCVAVLNEDSATPNHLARANFAKAVRDDPAGYVSRTIAYAAVVDGVISTASTDQAIQNRLGDLWTTLASGY